MNIVQIGCNNCDDELFNFIKDNQDSITKFIVVDALPKCVELAKEKYNFLNEKLISINCAIGLETEIIDFFYPAGDEISAHASVNKDHLEQHLHENVEKFSIQCVEINDFLSSHDLREIDLLAIDIEGLDVDVLLKIDFSKFKIFQIIYEFVHSDGAFKTAQKHDSLIEKLFNLNFDLKQISEYNILATLKITL